MDPKTRDELLMLGRKAGIEETVATLRFLAKELRKRDRNTESNAVLAGAASVQALLSKPKEER